MKVTINSQTSGKYETRYINNREHIVTKMVPIVGNSIMNKGFYPLGQVQNSFQQLHFLPAPNGHPKVENQLVSAFHPLAINAHNIGGMVRNPVMQGNKVINEFWLDTQIANQSDDGKELIRRIQNNEKVGVSTGLALKQVFTNGKHDGQDYEWVANDLQFDHVAILLNEKAAGEHVGTELQTNALIANCTDTSVGGSKMPEGKILDQIKKFLLNQGSEPLMVTANEVSTSDLETGLRVAARAIYEEDDYWVWAKKIFPESKRVIFEIEDKNESEIKLMEYTYTISDKDEIELSGDGAEVRMIVDFVPVDDQGDEGETEEETNETDDTPEEEVDMSNNNQTDKKTVAKDITVENAMKFLEEKGFVINTKEEADSLEFFVKNRSKIESIINAESEKEEAMRKRLVENSELTEEDVADMSSERLTRLCNSLIPAQDYSASGGGSSNGREQVVNSSDEDYLPSYTANAAENDNDSKGE